MEYLLYQFRAIGCARDIDLRTGASFSFIAYCQRAGEFFRFIAGNQIRSAASEARPRQTRTVTSIQRLRDANHNIQLWA